MKKSIYLIAAAAMTLAGCSQDDLMDNGTTGIDGDAIAFESYLGKNAQTRATVVTTESLHDEGFTVDAYYTGTADFSTENTGEVFMKATKVTYNENKGAWTYSPVKYWPNNAGDKVSFFAYGPYGNANIKLNADAVSSIDFTVQNDVLNQVDFIYGDQTTEANKTINRTKQDVTGKVKFQFQHALSRIAFTVAAAVDETSLGAVKLDGNSRINVKKVALVSGDVAEYTDDAAGPFYKSGTLNMWNGTWSGLSKETQAFTFAGKNHFYRTVTDKDVAANPATDIDVVQLHKFNQSQRLLNDDSYLMIIPTDNTTEGTKTSFKIYIEYDVITEDDNLADVSKITNCILSESALEVDFEAGKAYNFNLILGMTSVKFDVDEVVDWNDADNTDEWLPENEITYNATDDCFYIYNAAQLADMRNKVNANESYSPDALTRSSETRKYAEAKYVLKSDIDLSEYDNWEPIGKNSQNKFAGKFYGNGHTIRNLKINSEDRYQGLFGYVNYNGNFNHTNFVYLEDIKIENPVGDDAETYLKIKNDYSGAIIGYGLQYVHVKRCSFKGKIEFSDDGYMSCVGGIAGRLGRASSMTDCFVEEGSEIKVSAGQLGNCGGLIGEMNGYDGLTGCYNKGNVTFECTGSTDYPCGGIVGKSSGAYIRYCWNEGIVTGLKLGGICGDFCTSFDTNAMTACYNVGELNGTEVGGILHSTNYDYRELLIEKCYNAGTLNGSSIQAGIIANWGSTPCLVFGCYNTGDFINADCSNNYNLTYSSKSATAKAVHNSFYTNPNITAFNNSDETTIDSDIVNNVDETTVVWTGTASDGLIVAIDKLNESPTTVSGFSYISQYRSSLYEFYENTNTSTNGKQPLLLKRVESN